MSFFPGFGLLGRQKIPKIIEKYTTFLQVSWRECPRSGKISPFLGFISTREPFWNIFFLRPVWKMLRNTGGKWSRLISVKIRPAKTPDFFFSKNCLFLGKNALFQKNTRWGDATLQIYDLHPPIWPKNVDHKLCFGPKTLLSAEWEGYVDHRLKQYWGPSFLPFCFLLFAFGWFKLRIYIIC